MVWIWHPQIKTIIDTLIYYNATCSTFSCRTIFLSFSVCDVILLSWSLPNFSNLAIPFSTMLLSDGFLLGVTIKVDISRYFESFVLQWWIDLPLLKYFLECINWIWFWCSFLIRFCTRLCCLILFDALNGYSCQFQGKTNVRAIVNNMWKQRQLEYMR